MEYTIKKGTNVFDPLRIRGFFPGQCFNCGAPKHTQAFCPLIKCTHCNLWGHNQMVCRQRCYRRGS